MTHDTESHSTTFGNLSDAEQEIQRRVSPRSSRRSRKRKRLSTGSVTKSVASETETSPQQQQQYQQENTDSTRKSNISPSASNQQGKNASGASLTTSPPAEQLNTPISREKPRVKRQRRGTPSKIIEQEQELLDYQKDLQETVAESKTGTKSSAATDPSTPLQSEKSQTQSAALEIPDTDTTPNLVRRRNARRRRKKNRKKIGDSWVESDVTQNTSAARKQEASKLRQLNAACADIIQSIIKLGEEMEYVQAFLYPVDPAAHEDNRDYYNVIDKTRAISLTEMLEKTERKEYHEFDDFRTDLQVMLENALKYQRHLKSGSLLETMRKIKASAEGHLFLKTRKSKLSKLHVNIPTMEEFLEELNRGTTKRVSRHKTNHPNQQLTAQSNLSRTTTTTEQQQAVGRIGLRHSHFLSIRELATRGILIVAVDPTFREDMRHSFHRAKLISNDLNPPAYREACCPSKEIGMKHALLDIEEQKRKEHEGIIQTHYATKSRYKKKKKAASGVKLKPLEQITIYRSNKARYEEWKRQSKELNHQGEKLALEYQKLFPQWYYMQRFSMRSLILSSVGCTYELVNQYWASMMKQLLHEQKREESFYFVMMPGYDDRLHPAVLFQDLLTRLIQDDPKPLPPGDFPKNPVSQAERIVQYLKACNANWKETCADNTGRAFRLLGSLQKKRDPETFGHSRTVVYMLIHMADAPLLRNEEFQRALCTLMESPYVSCVLTYSNIYSRLLYDQYCSSVGRPYFCDISTFRPLEVGDTAISTKHRSQSDSFEIFKTNLSGMTRNVQNFMRVFITKYNQFENGASINELVDFCREEQTLQTWVGDYSKLENILLEPIENKMLKKKNQRYHLNVNSNVIEQLRAYFQRMEEDDEEL